MSDCSSEAMKPKERLKNKIGYVLRWKINDPDDTMSQITKVDVNDHMFIEEQRYQQLEQVAKEACIALNNYVDSFNREPWACSNHLFSLVKDFKEDLEALGVDINAGM